MILTPNTQKRKSKLFPVIWQEKTKSLLWNWEMLYKKFSGLSTLSLELGSISRLLQIGFCLPLHLLILRTETTWIYYVTVLHIGNHRKLDAFVSFCRLQDLKCTRSLWCGFQLEDIVASQSFWIASAWVGGYRHIKVLDEVLKCFPQASPLYHGSLDRLSWYNVSSHKNVAARFVACDPAVLNALRQCTCILLRVSHARQYGHICLVRTLIRECKIS